MQDESDQEKAIKFFKPFLDGRIRWLGGKAHGLLMYMAVLSEWRKRGVATMCVQHVWLGTTDSLDTLDLGRSPLMQQIHQSFGHIWGASREVVICSISGMVEPA